MEQLIPVNIFVADRSYRIKINPEEEEAVRRIMKEVNEKIIEFKTAYAGKDLQDYIAMALIMYATHPVTSGGKHRQKQRRSCRKSCRSWRHCWMTS